jgi:hypothetical protein
VDLPEANRVRALVLKNQDGEFVRAFALDDSAEKTATESLFKAADVLNEFHAMMRFELTGGWQLLNPAPFRKLWRLPEPTDAERH